MDRIVWGWRPSEDRHASPNPMSLIHVATEWYQLKSTVLFSARDTQEATR